MTVKHHYYNNNRIHSHHTQTTTTLLFLFALLCWAAALLSPSFCFIFPTPTFKPHLSSLSIHVGTWSVFFSPYIQHSIFMPLLSISISIAYALQYLLYLQFLLAFIVFYNSLLSFYIFVQYHILVLVYNLWAFV